MARRAGPRCAHCNAPLEAEGRRRDREYCDSSCRARAAEKRRSRQPAKQRGRSAQKRSRAAQTRRKPSVRISYRKTVDVMARAIHKRSAGISYERAVDLAHQELSSLLTERQRAAL